jgi:hypothetical protein
LSTIIRTNVSIGIVRRPITSANVPLATSRSRHSRHTDAYTPPSANSASIAAKSAGSSATPAGSSPSSRHP